MAHKEVYGEEGVHNAMETTKRERLRVEKKEKMMDELRKQMANDEVVSVKVEANEQIPKPKYYGLDALPAKDNEMDNGMD